MPNFYFVFKVFFLNYKFPISLYLSWLILKILKLSKSCFALALVEDPSEKDCCKNKK